MFFKYLSIASAAAYRLPSKYYSSSTCYSVATSKHPLWMLHQYPLLLLYNHIYYCKTFVVDDIMVRASSNDMILVYFYYKFRILTGTGLLLPSYLLPKLHSYTAHPITQPFSSTNISSGL